MSRFKGLLTGLAVVVCMFAWIQPRPLLADEGGVTYTDVDNEDVEYIDVDNEAMLQVLIDLSHVKKLGLHLTKDITLTRRIDIRDSRYVMIDLDNYNITSAIPSASSADRDGGMFHVDKTSTLYLLDRQAGKNALLQGGNARSGGAIYNEGTLRISGFTIRGCHARQSGGAIYNTGTLIVEGVDIDGCSADDMGGAIFNSGTLSYSAGTIKNSSARHGGGIASQNNATLTSVNLTNNSTKGYGGSGGAIILSGHNTKMTIDLTALSGNTAEDGAAIANSRTATDDSPNEVIIRNSSLITKNRSSGGPVISLGGFSLTLDSTEVSDNTSGGSDANLMLADQISIAGNVIIQNNKDRAGNASNLHLPGALRESRVRVIGPLGDRTRIYVDRTDLDVFTPSGPVTSDYSKFNEGVPPERLFIAERGIIRLDGGEVHVVRTRNLADVEFVDETGEARVANGYEVFGGETSLKEGIYLFDPALLGADSLRIEDTLLVPSHTSLIISPDFTLEALGGIRLEGEDSSLKIYGQPSGGGLLRCTGASGLPGIGVSTDTTGKHALGIYGVSVDATGGSGCAGIGGNSSLDVAVGQGATVRAHGGEGGAGIGGNAGQSLGSLLISGATVDAWGGSQTPATGAGIGSGSAGDFDARVTIEKGSTVRAFGSSLSAPIGAGMGGSVLSGATCAIDDSTVRTIIEGETLASNEWPAFGPGAGGTGTLGLTLADDLCVGTAVATTASSGGTSYELVPAAERIATCTRTGQGATKEVQITACRHELVTYTDKDGSHHTLSCRTCQAHSVDEAHSYDEQGLCVCGHKRSKWTVRYVSGTDVHVPDVVGDSIVLAGADLFDAPAGKVFDSWVVTMGERPAFDAKPGQRLALVADATITARWKDSGSASSDNRANRRTSRSVLGTQTLTPWAYAPTYGRTRRTYGGIYDVLPTRSRSDDPSSKTTDTTNAPTGVATGSGVGQTTATGGEGVTPIAVGTPAGADPATTTALPQTGSGTQGQPAGVATGVAKGVAATARAATPDTADPATSTQAAAAMGLASVGAVLCVAVRRGCRDR